MGAKGKLRVPTIQIQAFPNRRKIRLLSSTTP